MSLNDRCQLVWQNYYEFSKIVAKNCKWMVDRKREIFRDGGYASKILFPVEQNRCNRYWYQLLTVKRARRSQARVKLVGSNNEYISLNVTVGMNTCWEISFQLLEATTRDKRLYIFRAALQSSHGFLEHLYLLNDVSFFFLFSFFTKIHERLVTINHFSFSRIILDEIHLSM